MPESPGTVVVPVVPESPGILLSPGPVVMVVVPPGSWGVPVKRLLPSPGGPGVPPPLPGGVVLPSSDTGRTGTIGVLGGISMVSSSSKASVIIMGSPGL